MDLTGERLPGGNVGGAWRVGATVRRSVGPWTPAVHRLLAHLDGQLPCIPQVFGFDELGREILTYLPGQVVDVDHDQLTSGQLRSLVAWTRSFHQQVAGFQSDGQQDGPWRMPPLPNATLLCHNDIAPYNVCFDGDRLVGVFDWDLAGPSTPLFELAFIAWNCVPLWRDIGANQAAHRLEIIAESYGAFTALDILQAVPERITLTLDWIPVAAAAGDDGMAALLTAGEPERSQVALDDLTQRMPAIAEVLAARTTAPQPPPASHPPQTR